MFKLSEYEIVALLSLFLFTLMLMGSMALVKPPTCKLECLGWVDGETEWKEFQVVETWNPYFRGRWKFKYEEEGKVWRMSASVCRYK